MKGKLGARIAVIVIFAAVVYCGVKSSKIQHFFKTHSQIPKVLILGYIIFAGCFLFPIQSEQFSLDFQGMYVLVTGYGAIAVAFAGIR